MKPKKPQLEFAKSLIGDFARCGFLDHGPGWVQTWFDFALRWSDGPFGAERVPDAVAFVQIPDQNIDEFVARARQSEPALGALLFLVGTRLRAAEPIPGEISALAGEHLVHPLEFPPTHNPPKHWGRNYVIYHTMNELVFRYLIAPTMGSTQKGKRDTQPSAGEIVARASQDSELPEITVSTAQKIWTDENERNDKGDEGDKGPPQYHPAIHIVDRFDDPEEWVWV